MDQEDDAPPPYSAVDPLLTANNRRNANLHHSSASQDASSSEEHAVVSAPVLPTHFTSAVAYFTERPPTVLDDSRGILRHHITIYPRSQAKDFPRRPRCWASRIEEITQQDWDTFLQYLLPPHLGLAASSNDLPRQVRAEIRRDRKDCPQETDEQRHARITAVVSEWNQCFFELRAARIVFTYVADPDVAPPSALCPRCYPATTKATQQAPGYSGGQLLEQNVSAPAAQEPSPPNAWPPSPITPFHSPPPAMPYGAPFGTPSFAVPTPPNQAPGYYAPPPPHLGMAPWGWNNWNAQSQFQNPGSFEGGTLGWISQLASLAQKYGERFTEQAQQYGDQFSAQAQHYSRRVEEKALAHARWLEEQARLRERKGALPFGGLSRSPWGRPQAFVHEAYAAPQIYANNAVPEREETRNNNEQPSPERNRRASIISSSSSSSLSSIDSLSTTSELDASDLANVRAQLQALDDRHDRTLYDAAVDLRRQLSVLQESRREAHVSCRKTWMNGWRHQHHLPHRNDRSDWGRWESPEQQQRNSTERRAMKQEIRATKKAFRDVTRRARDEQKELRRSRRRLHRQLSKSTADGTATEQHDAAMHRMGNLVLNDPAILSVGVEGSDSSTAHLPRPLPASAVLSSEDSATATTSNSSSALQADNASSVDRNGKPSETPAKLLKPRKVKKQQKQQQRQSLAGPDTASVGAEDTKGSMETQPGSS